MPQIIKVILTMFVLLLIVSVLDSAYSFFVEKPLIIE